MLKSIEKIIFSLNIIIIIYRNSINIVDVNSFIGDEGNGGNNNFNGFNIIDFCMPADASFAKLIIRVTTVYNGFTKSL